MTTTQDFVFHYQKRENGKLVHDVKLTYSKETYLEPNPLAMVADFLRAIGYDFDRIEMVKSHKKDK